MPEFCGCRIDQGEVVAVLQDKANGYVPLDDGGIAVIRQMPHNREVGIDNATWLAGRAVEKGNPEKAFFYQWLADQIVSRQNSINELADADRPRSIPEMFAVSSLGLTAKPDSSAPQFPDPVRLSRPLLLDYFRF